MPTSTKEISPDLQGSVGKVYFSDSLSEVETHPNKLNTVPLGSCNNAGVMNLTQVLHNPAQRNLSSLLRNVAQHVTALTLIEV